MILNFHNKSWDQWSPSSVWPPCLIWKTPPPGLRKHLFVSKVANQEDPWRSLRVNGFSNRRPWERHFLKLASQLTENHQRTLHNQPAFTRHPSAAKNMTLDSQIFMLHTDNGWNHSLQADCCRILHPTNPHVDLNSMLVKCMCNIHRPHLSSGLLIH